MGLLDIFRPRFKADERKTSFAPSFKTITEYSPAFSTWSGRGYEKALVRASIEKTATLASKLRPEVTGNVDERVRRIVNAPNRYMSWPKMIGRLMTILLNDNTAAVVPALDNAGNIVGLFPLMFLHAEVVEYADEPWVRFYVPSGDTMAIELRNVCLVTRFQYESDFFGTSGDALLPTLKLLDYQDQANEQAIKNGARIQFIAAANGLVRPEDIAAKRSKFSEDNLSAENTSGMLIYDNTFDNVKQVEPMSYTVPTEEMERIESNVFYYYGTNKDLLQSTYTEEQFGAFYESQIEPFAVQLGEGLTQMMFSPVQQKHGMRWVFSANRLEYASNASKRNMIRDMADRAIMSINEGREVLQLPPIPGGDVFVMRGEYVMLDRDGRVLVRSGGDPTAADGKKDRLIEDGPVIGESDSDLGGDDDIYNDTDSRGTKEVDW